MTDSIALPSWQHFRELQLIWPRWIIEGLLPAESMICLYGKRGQGKTFLGIDWACSVATGTPWLGQKVARGGVAYLLAERPEGLKRRMLGWIARAGLSEDQGAALLDEASGFFFVAQGRHALDTAQGRLSIIDSLGQLPTLSLLIIDPLVVFMDGSENDTRDMQRFIDGVREIVKAHRCSVLLVHHEGKGNLNNALGARGSSALEAGLDTIIYLKSDRETSTLEVTKQREVRAIPPLFLNFLPVEDAETKRQMGIFPTLATPPAKAAPKPTRKDHEQQQHDSIIAVITAAAKQGKPALAVEEILGQIPGIKIGTLRARLKNLTAAKRLSQDVVGRMHRYGLPGAIEFLKVAAE